MKEYEDKIFKIPEISDQNVRKITVFKPNPKSIFYNIKRSTNFKNVWLGYTLIKWMFLGTNDASVFVIK